MSPAPHADRVKSRASVVKFDSAKEEAKLREFRNTIDSRRKQNPDN
jgi:serine/threonine protein kinase